MGHFPRNEARPELREYGLLASNHPMIPETDMDTAHMDMPGMTPDDSTMPKKTEQQMP
jgi:hypothetical protein